MIYEFKVQLKNTQPPVWRTLQVDSGMTFFEFHQVLQAAFEWEDSHLHVFNILKTNGRKSQWVEISPDYSEFGFSNENARDEEDELLSDWFVVEKDHGLYTYDFGADWEHDIVLLQILAPSADLAYPRCVEAAGWAPEEDGIGMEMATEAVSPKIVAAEVNNALKPWVQSVEADNGENNVWKHLLNKSKELNALKPWEVMDDDEIFMVLDPVSQERLFVSVLGGAGREFGLVVYIGEAGLRSLQLVVEQVKPLMEVVFIQRSLLLSFVDRDELEQDDYAFLKAHGLSFRGKKQWPEFRSMVPGSYPWAIDGEEARMLALAIEQTEKVFQLVQQGQELPVFMEEEDMFARIHRINDSGITWENSLVQVKALYPGEEQDQPAEQMVTDIDLHRAGKKPVFAGEIEFDLFYINMPVQPAAGERPYFPLMAAAIDSRSGIALYQDIFENWGADEAVQQGLLDFIEKFGKKPHTLLVKKEVHRLLEPILPALAINAKEAVKLPEMENLKAYLSQMNS